MKGIITSVMFVSLMTVVPMVQASEASVETVSNLSKTKEGAVALAGHATSWVRTAVPAFIKSIPGLAKDGYTFACDYAKENPWKTIAAATAALIVARAAYVIADNLVDRPTLIFFTDPPIVNTRLRTRIIPRFWGDSYERWYWNKSCEIRNKR